MNRATHDRPGDRPIHPECPTIRRIDAPCECMALWRGWDGTETNLRERITLIATRESRRRDWRGVSPSDGEDDLQGFWRESERLKVALANLEKAA